MLAPECGGVHAQCRTGTLHKRALRRHIDAERKRDAMHPFRADHADLEAGLLVDWGDQRDVAIDREIHMVDAVTAFA